MSDTTTADPPVDTTADVAPVADPPVADQTAAPADPAPDATPEPEPQPKPKQADRRFAAMTAKLAAEATARAEAEKRADAAEALLRAGKPDGDTKPVTRQPSVEEAAEKLLQEREFNTKIKAIDLAGKKEFGHEAWEDAKNTMTSLGASGNTAFLAALAETEHPQKIFAQLAEDTDTLLSLMNKSPAAMAAQLGRMDAKMAQPAPTKPLSAAPRPPAPVTSGGVTAKEIDPFGDEAEKLSMAEWNTLFEKTDTAKRLLRRRA